MSASAPARPAPKRQFGPATTASAPHRAATGARTRDTNAAGGSAASSRVKGRRRQAAAPASASASKRIAPGVSGGGARSGARTASGCGSNVRTHAAAPRSRARPRAASRIARCPRWTPSKNPAASTTPPVPPSTSSGLSAILVFNPFNFTLCPLHFPLSTYRLRCAAITRRAARSSSRRLIVSRLSNSVLPRQTPSRSLTRPRLR